MRVQQGCLRAILVVLSILCGYCWMGLGMGGMCGLMLYATTYGGVYMLYALVYFITLAILTWWLTWNPEPAKNKLGDFSSDEEEVLSFGFL
eukprot:TRINITY_DN98821_c0_g1_i1.p1 TRINITY_DN98821_c0_g1~~TRINITY_DN98821_c0_g1_i1.p1  ORF type:complete len:104 (-),score=10.78 TRINITY_DN98821_c0_g1_i1:171-443(-)